MADLLFFQDLFTDNTKMPKNRLPAQPLWQTITVKRAGIEKIMGISVFKEKALQWKRYDHEYSSIHENVYWSCLNEAWAHKRCKGNFYKETYMIYDEPNISK